MSDSTTDRFWVGFDLGGTKMLATVLNAEFRLVARKRRKTKGHEGDQTGLIRVCETIDEALKEAGIDRSRLGGIGLGCPGPLDLDRGIMIDAPNLGWKNVPIQAAVEKEFGCPVVIANDVDLGVYGEYRLGAARGARSVLGVFPGTGIGGGYVYEGRILRGKTQSCMEIGHIQVVPGGPLCGCGLRGCLEAVASRLAISAAAAAAVHRGQAPKLRALAGTDLSEIRSGVLAEAIRGGDTAVERIVRDAAEKIGIAVAGVVHLLSPDVVVLGGGLVEAMAFLLLPAVETSARAHVMKSYRDTFRVVPAKLGDDATVTGAAAWASECVAHGM